MKDDDKIYELRKDISLPGRYFRAGQQRSKSAWKALFPDAFKFDERDWFIDIAAVEEAKKDSRSVKQIIVDEVFARHELKSLSYKEAAMECMTRYAKLRQLDRTLVKELIETVLQNTDTPVPGTVADAIVNNYDLITVASKHVPATPADLPERLQLERDGLSISRSDLPAIIIATARDKKIAAEIVRRWNDNF